MKGAVLVAIAAAVGNLLQGWDNATIAGAVLYIKREFKLESEPTIEGLIVAMSLIGATVITTFSGPAADSVGRRPMLIASSMLYFVSGLVMIWSPSVYVLLLARLLDGFGIGLAVTLVPVYISETAPPEIRGTLNTLPQFAGCAGMFFSYCMVFGMSLTDSPSWRLMLGVLSIPSMVYFALTVMFLPESPRWLVSKGKMVEAEQVLRKLRGVEDVSGEMALLVEGLDVGGETDIKEYIIGPANDLYEDKENVPGQDQIRLFGAEEGVSYIARPAIGQESVAPLSRRGSAANQSSSLIDPLVTLFGSVHEKVPETGSMLFSNFGSMFLGDQVRNEQFDEENPEEENEENESSDASEDESEDNLHSPLLSQQPSKSNVNLRQASLMQVNPGEPASGVGIGGGWQLAYQVSEEASGAGKKTGVKRIYLHEEIPQGSRYGSIFSTAGAAAFAEGEVVHASALVSHSVVHAKGATGQHPIEPNMIKPPESAVKGPSWHDLFEPGVKHALVVGVGIQLLQQFSGINGVMYYTPQILEQAGVGVLLSNMGIRSDSASLLISGVTSLLMLPSIGIAMRLMDIAGRRWLLLSTLPILLLSLVVLVLGSILPLSSFLHAIISTVSVVVYFCCFVTGFGPIPNILCSEIFPTRVRGLCIAICALTFWTGDIIVTYSLPVMLTSIGLAGVFGMYAVVCAIAWVFVYMKVPETKGMPLEVISEFFAVGAKQN